MTKEEHRQAIALLRRDFDSFRHLSKSQVTALSARICRLESESVEPDLPPWPKELKNSHGMVVLEFVNDSYQSPSGHGAGISVLKSAKYLVEWARGVITAYDARNPRC